MPELPPVNTALWLPAKRAAFKVGPASYTPPRADEIVIRARAVATNPIDWLLQAVGDIIFPWLAYPTVLGSDVAGEVVEVGSGVSRFKAGDRVLALSVGSDKDRNNPAEGAFQHYVVALAGLAAPIPDDMRFEDAVVLPLGIATAAAGLFQKDFLALRPPSARPEPLSATVLIWGGSTSVGSNAIQLAAAAGYDVITTASPRNFDYVNGLGARQAFDYGRPTVVKDIVAALSGQTLAGALAIGAGSAAPCVAVVRACRGARIVAMATPPASFDHVPVGAGRIWRLLPTLVAMLAGNVALALKTGGGRAKTRFIFASSIRTNEVGHAIFEDFLPSALAEGRYRTAPEALLAGQGLDQIPAAIERHRQGVSARKVVVSL
jgi:NADPH:quinone reductase-like Zn-dependent oxidoreductase